MSASHAYIVVEGPHDLEMIAALLRPVGFQRTKLRTAVDAFWDPLIPKTFPHNDDLLARVPVPMFFQSSERWVAIHAVSGETRLVSTVQETLAVLPSPPSSIGAVLDADSTKPPAERFAQVAAGLRKHGLMVPAAAGDVSPTLPRCGIYVLPDNTSSGTLEDLMLECAAIVYPSLLGAARTFVDGVDPKAAELADDDMKDFARGAGRLKATIASMASVLRPGKAIRNSIQDNRWLKDPRARALPRIASIHHFLMKLLDLGPMPPTPETSIRSS
jgi:hypothetical protein